MYYDLGVNLMISPENGYLYKDIWFYKLKYPINTKQILIKIPNNWYY